VVTLLHLQRNESQKNIKKEGKRKWKKVIIVSDIHANKQEYEWF